MNSETVALYLSLIFNDTLTLYHCYLRNQHGGNLRQLNEGSDEVDHLQHSQVDCKKRRRVFVIHVSHRCIFVCLESNSGVSVLR